MFGKIQIRNNRKVRLSNWFSREADGDMQAFDVQGVVSGIGGYLSAVLREDGLRRSARAASA